MMDVRHELYKSKQKNSKKLEEIKRSKKNYK